MGRNLQMDTVKGLLIICVVLGHVIGNVGGLRNDLLSSKVYDFIYVFHMPLFIWVSGYFTRWKASWKAFFSGLAAILIPFFIFHCITVAGALVAGKPFEMRFITVPGWALWFLLTLAYMRVIIQVLHSALHKWPVLCFCISVLISIVCGMLPGGHEFSVQRTMHFLPFFLLGYYMGQGVFPQLRFPKWLSICVILAIVAILAFDFLPADYRSLLYGANPYGYERILPKIYLLACSFALSMSVFSLCDSNKLLADFGQDSMIYYLYHTILIPLMFLPLVNSLNLPASNMIHAVIYTALVFGIIALMKKLKLFRCLVNPLR